MWACQNGNAYRGQIPFFIKHGASANESESLMPMQWAIFTGAVGVAQELIENGADLNYISDSGESILQMAVDSDNKQVVELMVINGANLDIVDHDGNTPLHWAVNTGAIDTTRMLLYNKADATKMNNEGKTPRDMAISLGKDRIAKILKKYLA
jgi:ankyrin repeat protein